MNLGVILLPSFLSLTSQSSNTSCFYLQNIPRIQPLFTLDYGHGLPASAFVPSLFLPQQPDHITAQLNTLLWLLPSSAQKPKSLQWLQSPMRCDPSATQFSPTSPLLIPFQHSGLRTVPRACQVHSHPCCSLCLQHSSLREPQGFLPHVLQILALLPLKPCLTSPLKAASLHALFSNSLTLLYFLP